MIIKRVFLKEKEGGASSLYKYPAKGENKAYEEAELHTLILTQYNDNVNVYFYGLSEYKMLIFNLLYRAGYTGIVTTRKADLHAGEYRYTLSGSNCYYIQILQRVQGKKKYYLTLMNVEHVIGIQDYTKDPEEIFAAYDAMRSIGVSEKQPNRILYSAGAVARAYARKNSQGLVQISSYIATHDYKGLPLNQCLEKWTRPAVRGGFVYWSLNASGYNGPGVGVDCNSIYTYVCTRCDMPGRPLSMGKGKDIGETGYYIYRVKLSGLKCTGIPCIKRDNALRENYITEVKDVTKVVDGKKVTEKGSIVLTLTETDLETLKDNYTYDNIEYIWFLRFERTKHTFDYMKTLYESKRGSSGAMRGIYKLLQNSLTGSLAKKPYKDKSELIEADGMLVLQKSYLSADEYKTQLAKVSGMCYISAAIYSAARAYLLKTIKSIPGWEGRWLYSDTDSIYLKGSDVPDTIPISDACGAYKIEHTFDTCTFIGSKMYILKSGDDIHIIWAGVPDETKRYIKQTGYSISDILEKDVPIISLKEDYEAMEIVKNYEWRRLLPDAKPIEKEEWDPWFYQDKWVSGEEYVEAFNAFFGGFRFDFEQVASVLTSLKSCGLKQTLEQMYG